MDAWFIIGSISAILPVIFIKEYLISNKIIFILLSLVCYLILIKSYIHIFSKNTVSIAYTILQLLQILIVVLMGILFFKEGITLNKTIGVILAIISIYYLTNK